MTTCHFCGNELKLGTGKMFVKKDGKVLYFCSRTCQKNLLKLKRKPSEIRWTTHYVKGGQ